MMVYSGNVTKRLLEKLLREQKRKAERERKMSFAEKLKVVDQLMVEGEPRVEETDDPLSE
jgi:hypothetical protein